MSKFKLELGEPVKLSKSEEKGHVTARAEYENGENQYLIVYLAADGRQVDAWWPETQIRQEHAEQSKQAG
jgi:hypothetical protein